MLTPAKMGWMAGIIDLKGHIYIKKNAQRSTRQIVLTVDSKFPGIIRELGVLCGTKPESANAKPLKDFMRRSCNEHCPEAHIHVDDRIMPGIHRWTITGIALAVVLDALEPVLTEDKGFPEYKDEILSTMDMGGRGSGQVMATLNKLQLLGWPMPARVVEVLAHQEKALRVLTGGGEGGQADS